MTAYFSQEQIEALSAPLARSKVSTREAAGGMKLSYIESHVAIRTANTIFGFDGWSTEVIDLRCIIDKSGDKHTASYIARVRVTVYAGTRVLMREDVGAGHGRHTDAGQAHEKALKEAASDAQKRCLRHFGDQFGLALYDRDQEHVVDDAPATQRKATEPAPPAPPPGPISTRARAQAAPPAAAQRKPAEEISGELYRVLLAELKDIQSPPDLSRWMEAARDRASRLTQSDRANLRKACEFRRSAFGVAA